MQVEVVMPRLSDSMTEGAVVAWLKNEGEAVAEGEAIAEIETDKSSVDLEAPASGVVVRVAIAAGTENVAVGTVLAVIETDAAAVRGASPAEPRSRAVQPGGGETAATVEGSVVAASADSVAGTHAALIAPLADSGASQTDTSIAATPLARRMAVQAGIVLTSITPTGIGGKICKADIEAALHAKKGTGPFSTTPQDRLSRTATTDAAAGPIPNGTEIRQAFPLADRTARTGVEQPRVPADRKKGPVPFSGRASRMRRSIAERMSHAKQTIPHFYLSVDCRVDQLIETRRRLNEDGPAKLSLNDFVVRAAALALKRIPAANAAWTDDGLQLHERVDIAVAVALDDGLVTPVVRAADTLGLAAISTTVGDLATRARAGTLAPHEYDGGTFTVSNLGMFGVGTMYAIINPPQACILGVGAAEPRPVVRDGQLEAGTVMTLSLSADHRVIDGAIGARLLAEIRRLLEDPARMLL